MNQAQQTNTTQKMLRQMATRYGPIMGGTALRQALGFSSAAAMRQAVLRGQVGVQLFSLKNRRGKFALTQDVVRWLADCMSSDGSVVAAATPPPALHSTSRGLTAFAQRSQCE